MAVRGEHTVPVWRAGSSDAAASEGKLAKPAAKQLLTNGKTPEQKRRMSLQPEGFGPADGFPG